MLGKFSRTITERINKNTRNNFLKVFNAYKEEFLEDPYEDGILLVRFYISKF
jgi:hypothetical protein